MDVFAWMAHAITEPSLIIDIAAVDKGLSALPLGAYGMRPCKDEQQCAIKSKDGLARVKERGGLASNSLGVAASWHNTNVAASRLIRDQVTITVDGATTVHKSVRSAFQHFGLPDSKHIRFRVRLKRERTAVFEHEGKAYHFALEADQPAQCP
ncbi:hypothetical protein [Cupriavidus nantongensis]|uniref:Uncharacterized protein n=1 Tax=Cupriavidus nantongensis TaxID=1796606 RepID=A0A142JNH3_9BURK|nr:hypothetical protein [Cupriavidus nantongensis]AMR79635.1 hypothetical protein A2G96_18825 [Cupriavidus nantongensis]